MTGNGFRIRGGWYLLKGESGGVGTGGVGDWPLLPDSEVAAVDGGPSPVD